MRINLHADFPSLSNFHLPVPRHSPIAEFLAETIDFSGVTANDVDRPVPRRESLICPIPRSLATLCIDRYEVFLR